MKDTTPKLRSPTDFKQPLSVVLMVFSLRLIETQLPRDPQLFCTDRGREFLEIQER